MNTTRLTRFLALSPVALHVPVEDHVHALEDEALGLVREGDDPLAAQDVGPWTWVRFEIHGMNFSGSTSPSILAEIERISLSW